MINYKDIDLNVSRTDYLGFKLNALYYAKNNPNLYEHFIYLFRRKINFLIIKFEILFQIKKFNF